MPCSGGNKEWALLVTSQEDPKWAFANLQKVLAGFSPTQFPFVLLRQLTNITQGRCPRPKRTCIHLSYSTQFLCPHAGKISSTAGAQELHWSQEFGVFFLKKDLLDHSHNFLATKSVESLKCFPLMLVGPGSNSENYAFSEDVVISRQLIYKMNWFRRNFLPLKTE